MTNKTFPIRAAAILTTSEVNGTSLPIQRLPFHRASILLELTIGSLSMAVFRFYASTDDSTWYPIADTTGAVEQTLDATGSLSVCIDAPGWRSLRVSAQGYGTTTNSSATVTALYPV